MNVNLFIIYPCSILSCPPTCLSADWTSHVKQFSCNNQSHFSGEGGRERERSYPGHYLLFLFLFFSKLKKYVQFGGQAFPFLFSRVMTDSRYAFDEPSICLNHIEWHKVFDDSKYLI